MEPITFVLLDNSRTTYGVKVLIDGVDTEQFERNPVMFYQHNDWNLPVGRWENLRKESGQILADAVFDEDDTDAEVQRMIKKVQKGFIKMASCGLVDLVTAVNPLDEEYTVTQCRLREASIVAIGGNHNAIRLYDNDGKEIDLKEGASLKLSDFIVKPKIEKMDKELLQLLNLSDTASPAEQKARIELLLADKTKAETDLLAEKAKVAAFEAANANARKAEALTLTDAAVKDGRIDAKAKQSVLNLFDKDHEAAKLMLESITKPTSIKEQLNLSDKQKTELETLSLMDFDAMDKAGKLGKVKTDFPELYAEKFEAKFGKKPNA